MYTCSPMYPGPVSVHQEVLKVISKDYSPARYSKEYEEMYAYVCNSIQNIAGTKNDVVLATGEAMLGLWTALKSCLKAGDKVLCVGNGVFGDGFADMAKALQLETRLISFPYDTTFTTENIKEVEKVIDEFKPTMITAVHCDTPSGTLNPLAELGELKKRKNVPLLVVDAVASIGGVPIFADDWNIDILLGGSQKALSCPPDMTIMTISPTAWEYIDKVSYVGYEALKPFMGIGFDVKKYPYTPNTQGVYALGTILKVMENEGYENVFKRHEEVALICREGIKEIGLKLYPKENAVSSPTCTAIYIPDGKDWAKMHEDIKEEGVFLGGSYGSLSGTVFRLGHMGTQANTVLMQRALEVLASYLK